MRTPLVSIVIASYNSASILPRVLESIRTQVYPKSSIEILVIDGGSTDQTVSIARSYGCRVIHNPKILPLWAKHIGYMKARGSYALFLDSDEVIKSSHSIARKIAAFRMHSSIHAVSGSGYRSPPDYIFLNQYINEFGDPFSFFYYRLSKDSRYFIAAMKRSYRIVSETQDYVEFDLSGLKELPLFEFGAMGGVIDLKFLRVHVPEIATNPSLITHVVNVLASKGATIALVKNDVLMHYSSDTYRKYLGKITSRIINNIYTPSKEGFTGRSANTPILYRLKKYVFLPYAYSLIFPFFDAAYLCISRRSIGYLIHVPLTLYTASLIVFYSLKKLFGYHVTIKSYGEAVPIG